MLERLRESVIGSRVIEIGDYQYFIHPVTDGIPHMDPELLSEITDAIIAIGDFRCDVILCPESMGIHLAVPVSMRLGIPYSIIRKRSYGLPGETEIDLHTGYSERHLFINGIEKGDRVVIIDDVLSTGGTICAVTDALRNMGADVVDIITVFEKDPEAKERIERKFGVPVKSLLRVGIVDGRTVCID